MTVPDGFSCDAPDEPAGSAMAPPLGPSSRGLPCGARLAEAVRGLAAAKRTDPSALALAALLLVPDCTGDPGACDPGERDLDGSVVLLLRPVVTASDSAVRRALAAAVALADPAFRIVPAADVGRLEAAVETLGYRNKTLAHALKRLSFQPLDGRVTELRDAVQMFGFVNEWCFDEEQVRRRFRELAPVYHPDTGVVACRERMGQLLDARNLLVRHVRTVYGSGAWMGRQPAQ